MQCKQYRHAKEGVTDREFTPNRKYHETAPGGTSGWFKSDKITKTEQTLMPKLLHLRL